MPIVLGANDFLRCNGRPVLVVILNGHHALGEHLALRADVNGHKGLAEQRLLLQEVD